MNAKKVEPTDKASSKKPTRPSSWLGRSFLPFRKATLRGLAVILPPLLTIVFFIWVWGALESYVLSPVETVLKQSIIWSIQDIRENDQINNDSDLAKQISENDGRKIIVTSPASLTQIESGQWIPLYVADFVENNPGDKLPQTANEYYDHFVARKYLQRHLVIPAFLALFLAVLYLLGKLLAAGVGRIFYSYFENLITQLPIIRNVYSSVKQVTDFAFSESEFEYTRIVAVEYPRRGIWSMGFVTGEGMNDIRNAAGEPILTVLMPTSPMPATGFTISVPKSETVDLEITIDQAIQFCVSCGVVIPEHQQSKSVIDGEVRTRFDNLISPTVNGSAATIQDETTTRISENGSEDDNAV